MRSLLPITLVLLLAAGAADAATIELANGDKFEAEVVEETDTALVVEHPVLGRMEIPKSSLKPEEEVQPGLFGTRILRGFNRKFAFGINGAAGNSDNLGFNGMLTIQNETENYRSFFEAAYFFAQQRVVRVNPATGNTAILSEAERNSNSAYVAYLHDFLFPKLPVYVFTKTRYQYDEFQAWQNRFSISVGPGWDFIKREKFEGRLEIGAGGARTFGCEGRVIPLGSFEAALARPCEGFNQWTPEGVLGLVLGWRPISGHSFGVTSTYFPVLTDWSELRLLTDALYTISITGIDGLSLRIGVNHEYLSDPGALAKIGGTPLIQRFPLQNNNVKYFLNIGYEF